VSGSILLQLLVFFLTIAPFTIAGAQTLIPELYRYFVTTRGHMTGSEFATVIALAQIAPGPNMLVVSLLGWKVAGLAGLLTATTAVIGPTSVAAYFFARWIDRLKNARWLTLTKIALAPIVIGLMLASGAITSRAANHDVIGYALTAASAALIYFTSRNPLWVLCSGAAIGVFAHRMGLMSLPS
jgi:chromate transporter